MSQEPEWRHWLCKRGFPRKGGIITNTYPTILLATGFFILSKTFLRPAVLSLTSKQATIGQGAAMGLSNSFMSLGRIVGPLWAGFIFDVNFDYPYLSLFSTGWLSQAMTYPR